MLEAESSQRLGILARGCRSAAPLSRLQSRSFPFGKLRVRTSPAGSDARKTAQIKTGAYSPPRFSAPALKASRNRENQAAHLLPANLFAEQRRVYKSKMDEKLCITKMPCGPEAGQ